MSDDRVTTTASLVPGHRTPLPERLSLVVAAGPDEGSWLALPEGTYLVGSAPECHLRLTDSSVSRQHLQVVVAQGGIEVRDLGSKNGSYYLGARFEKIQLGAGVQITVGTSSLVILSDEEKELPLYPGDRFGRLVGGSVVMRRVFSALDRLARTDTSILLVGETGTGKDLAAQAVHEASGRARGPFVICDLGAVPGSLIESELFGHVRGAFTGADRDRAGAFEQADGGTIFLDEVGELALELQPRLLRVLETASVKRLGETRYRRTDARVISATNRHLSAEVQSDRFRSDLFYRLTVAQVRIPALRERLDDMPALVDALLADLAMRGAGQLTASPELISALRAYDWPGNVRQLRNVIERAVALGLPGGILSPAVLGLDPDPGDESRVRHKIDASVPFKEAKDRLVVHWEREYVSSLLEKCAGNVSRAARVAGLDRAHLYRLLHRHGLLKPGK